MKEEGVNIKKKYIYILYRTDDFIEIFHDYGVILGAAAWKSEVQMQMVPKSTVACQSIGLLLSRYCGLNRCFD